METDMRPQHKTFRISKSIAGTVLVLLGAFILYQDLAGAIARVSHANGAEALGVLPAALLAFSQTVQTYAFDHQRFLQALVPHLLLSSWPLLLVICGTALSKDPADDESKHVDARVNTLASPGDLR
jgi:hypothetical protein